MDAAELRAPENNSPELCLDFMRTVGLQVSLEVCQGWTEQQRESVIDGAIDIKTPFGPCSERPIILPTVPTDSQIVRGYSSGPCQPALAAQR